MVRWKYDVNMKRIKVNLFEAKYGIILVNENKVHWWLCIIEFAEKKIYCLDSLHEGNHDCEMALVLEYLSELSEMYAHQTNFE